VAGSQVGIAPGIGFGPRSVAAAEEMADRKAFIPLATLLLRLSFLRTTLIQSGQLTDAGWNMLLDLYVNEEQGRSTCVSSLGIASGAPQTTSLRQIQTMERLGLVRVETDRSDRRRRCVQLSTSTKSTLDAYLRIAAERIEKQVRGS
jgi:DNA-binding MarR family transcriptional regulator